MKKCRQTIVSIILGMLLIPAFASDVAATNGYFSHGYGVANKAMAGVGVALPRDAFIAATNPAGMVSLGNRYDINISMFNPNRQYTVTGNPSGFFGTFPLAPGTVESDSKLFFIPGIAANWMINQKTSFGISIYGNGGMNTDYNTKVYDNPMAPVTSPTGVNLAQLFMTTTFARQFNPKHSLGVSVIAAYQMFEAKGLQAFMGFSSDPNNLSNNDNANSTGIGFRVGYLGNFDRISFGASYQSKIFMSEFDDYAGLFAEAGDFDIPSNWTVGIAVKASRVLTLAADVQQVRYSEVNAVANPMVPADFMTGVLLGMDNGAGFGWEDMTTFKFGLEWEGIVDMPLRLGYSYGEQPIPESEMMFNILAPGVIQQHITFGFTRKLCKGREISLAVMKALNYEINGPNPMEAPGQQDIMLEMNQWEFTLGFSF